jgi:hypothetical protein
MSQTYQTPKSRLNPAQFLIDSTIKPEMISRIFMKWGVTEKTGGVDRNIRDLDMRSIKQHNGFLGSTTFPNIFL